MHACWRLLSFSGSAGWLALGNANACHRCSCWSGFGGACCGALSRSLCARLGGAAAAQNLRSRCAPPVQRNPHATPPVRNTYASVPNLLCMPVRYQALQHLSTAAHSLNLVEITCPEKPMWMHAGMALSGHGGAAAAAHNALDRRPPVRRWLHATLQVRRALAAMSPCKALRLPWLHMCRVRNNTLSTCIASCKEVWL